MRCLAVFLAVCLTACADAPLARVEGETVAANAVVADVVDGDTLSVRIDGQTEPVRLIGIDTPETVRPNSPVECFGPEASERTRQLLPPGTRVSLVRDLEARDHYGRLLAYVYRASDGLFVNLALVDEGYATVLTFPPNTTHSRAFVAAASSAQRRSLGLWGACAG
ncbi:MAG: hypothetical protein RI958_2560 [Actinomycetota bacterium]